MIRQLKKTLFLPGRLCSRWASYLSDVKDLTLQGSTESRRWIGCMEEFWLNVASDYAEWLRAIGFGDEPNMTFPPAQEVWISPDYPVVSISVEVPASVFQHFETKEVVLYPSPLEVRGTVVGFPGSNLQMDNPNLTPEDRRTRLRIFDLPTLQPGMELRGVIWAAPLSQGKTRSAPLVIATLVLRTR